MEEPKAEEEEKRLVLERRAKRTQVKVKLWTDDEEKNQDPFADVEDDDEDAACIYCNSLYSQSKSGELWLRCQKCKKWSHAECAGVSRRTKFFTCELCN
ncbi:uncharacterized protein LOC126740690 [Anthonomus grandis grandis]|uniref:uncharacterized protein LOC126740690 n=1 Tax=Anthonomus grandis grandis TaxID=2921223 RepID=UPI002165BC3E|nr:uncharacterized protein LOC126740690 [Anthonomus grandis grandis]